MFLGFILVAFNCPTVFGILYDVTNVRLPSLPSLETRGGRGGPEDAKSVTCGTYLITTNSSYRIQTTFQHFQAFYPSGFDCTWRFFASRCFPSVTCSEFDVAESTDCSNAYLEITDEYSVSKKFCGTNGPNDTATGSSILTAKFPRSFSIPRKGFNCLVTCSSTLEGVEVLNKSLSPPSTANCSCGIPGPTSDVLPSAHRIVGGKEALPNYYKWQVALVPKTRGSPFCGGTLINDRFVLSAAHCVVHTGLIAIPPVADVILNAYNLKNSSEITLRRGVIGIYPHPFYDTVGQDYDFSLIEFSDPVNLVAPAEPPLTPVCLPAIGNQDTFEGKMGTVTGWGVTAEGGKQSMILKEADIPIISNEACAQQYQNGSKARITITDRMLCATYEEGGVDACQGDSGGPFVLKNDIGRFMSIGVVSFGEGCARPGKPGVYSRVTEVSDWIRVTAKRGTWCSN